MRHDATVSKHNKNKSELDLARVRTGHEEDRTTWSEVRCQPKRNGVDRVKKDDEGR